MAEHGNVGINIAVIAARAGVRREACICAGRFSNNVNIVVAEGRNACVGIAVAALRAGVRCVAGFRAGWVGNNSIVVVAGSRNRPCFGCAAARTGSGLFARFRTGRSCRLCPCAEVMAKCRNLSIGVAVAALRTGVRCVAGFRAGRVGNDCSIAVAEGCNILQRLALRFKRGVIKRCRVGRFALAFASRRLCHFACNSDRFGLYVLCVVAANSCRRAGAVVIRPSISRCAPGVAGGQNILNVLGLRGKRSIRERRCVARGAHVRAGRRSLYCGGDLVVLYGCGFGLLMVAIVLTDAFRCTGLAVGTPTVCRLVPAVRVGIDGNRFRIGRRTPRAVKGLHAGRCASGWSSDRTRIPFVTERRNR